MDKEAEDKIKRILDVRDKYARKMDLLRKEQSDIIDAFRLKLEERKKEEVMKRLNS